MQSRLLSVLRILAACALIPVLSFGQVAQPSPPLDKHARKIQQTLSSYPPGSVIFVEMRDQSQHLGTLSTLSASTFELVPRSGGTLNLAYSDVSRIQKADSSAGNVIVVKHHNGLVVGLVAAGAVIGFLIFAVIELKKS